MKDYDDPKKMIGSFVRDARVGTRTKMAWLAKKSGLTESTISHLESGQNTRTLTLAMVCYLIGFDAKTLGSILLAAGKMELERRKREKGV